MNTHRAIRRDDAGFTLIELMVTIAIMGIIMLPLGNLVIEYFQNTVSTQARAAESHDEQIAAAYFGGDVVSLGQRNSDGTTKQSVWYPTTSGAPIACGSGITPFLALAWGEYSSAGVLSTSEVVYGTQTATDAGRSELQLVRLRCANSSSTPVSTAILAHNLTATPTVACDVTCTNASPLPSVISMTLSLRAAGDNTPYSVTLSGQRRQT